jgi:hypothetical protein
MIRPIFSSLANKKRVFTSMNFEEVPFSDNFSITFSRALCLWVRFLIWRSIILLFNYPINTLVHIINPSAVKVIRFFKLFTKKLQLYLSAPCPSLPLRRRRSEEERERGGRIEVRRAGTSKQRQAPNWMR